MLNKQLLAPQSIVVVGASNDITKPGGKILKNLLEHEYKGDLMVFNPNSSNIQGVKTYHKIEDLPETDLAILAIPAARCPEIVEFLAQSKNVRAFIVISGGFSETGEAGKILEERMTAIVNKTGGCLIGPNCIGVLTPEYAGVFTTPIPHLRSDGCDFVSGSGATAVFIVKMSVLFIFVCVCRLHWPFLEQLLCVKLLLGVFEKSRFERIFWSCPAALQIRRGCFHQAKEALWEFLLLL